MPDALIVFSEALAATPVSRFLQGIGWLIPLVQTVHILAIAAVMGSAGLADLRLLGLAGRSRSAAEMAGSLAPAVWWALLVLACSGAVLAIAEPLRSVPNPAFQLKMLLLLLAAALTGFMQGVLRGRSALWDLSPGLRLAVKLAAAVSLLLWIAIIFAGRWIAFLDTGLA